MIALRALAIAATMAFSVPALAQAPGTWGPWHDGAMWWWWMPFHGLMWLLVVGVLVAAGVALIRWLIHGTDRPSRGAQKPAALDVLDARYARGEIEREEYLQRRKDILDGGPRRACPATGRGPARGSASATGSR